MESRIRRIFLTLTAVLASFPAWAQDSDVDTDQPPQVIEPEVERRELDIAALDTEDFELTAFMGVMGVEDFESGFLVGARFAYHVNPALFAEVTYGRTDAGTTSAERLGGGAPILSSSERKLKYYDVSVGWNVLPGEVFPSANRAWNSAFYLIGGVGSTDFAGDDNFTVNFGFGLKFLPTDSIAVRIEARDYLFSLDVTGEDKVTNNLQGTINIGWYF